jgi:hypothetical protein
MCYLCLRAGPFRIWSGRWESNPRPKLGKLLYCHCTTPALVSILLIIIHNRPRRSLSSYQYFYLLLSSRRTYILRRPQITFPHGRHRPPEGGIYRHFDSKEELAAAAFDYSWLKAANSRLDGIDDSANSVDGLKKMIGNFVELRSDLVPGGCPLMNTARESDDGNPILRARARKALQSWASLLSKIIRRGIAHRQINSTIHPQKNFRNSSSLLSKARFSSAVCKKVVSLSTMPANTSTNIWNTTCARKPTAIDPLRCNAPSSCMYPPLMIKFPLPAT